MITRIAPPASRLRVGHCRIDITPPVGIYHRLWGAARHDRASGVHRPILADVLALAPLAGDGPPLIRVQTDLCGLVTPQHEALASAIAADCGVARDRVVMGYSHSHSSGWYVPDRIPLPGGEHILPYLERLSALVSAAATDALAAMQPATITYATGRCTMAANRDCWDDARQIYVCGYAPDQSADDTLLLGRVTDATGRLLATLVNYACHPTTLAWENSLLSPDFAGAMRATVEAATGAPCVYFQGTCGDLGPRHGFVGDTAVADQNGRELGYAALATLERLGPPGTAFTYTGPVVSGATLGVWAHQPLDEAELVRQAIMTGGTHTVDLPVKERPSPDALRTELADWEARQRAADAAGDVTAARDAGARAERARRWLARLEGVAGPTYTFHFSVHRFGDAVWVTCGAEPYSLLQVELRRRFPDQALVISPLNGDFQVAYLLPRDRYGRGLYQEEPSSLAPGSLELLIDAISAVVRDEVRPSPRSA